MTKSYDQITLPHLSAGRAVDQLRRQLGVVIEAGAHTVGNYPVESINENILVRLRSPGLRLLITGARAQSLGLGYADCKIDANGLSLAEIMAIADPTADTLTLPKLFIHSASEIDTLALKLAKYSSLLPALLLVNTGEIDTASWLHVKASDIAEYWNNPPLEIVSLVEANMPIDGAEDAKIICFRQRFGTSVHLTLVFGELKDAPLARVHSSCVTGDILGSLRCDCGDQLALAIEQLRESGNGILLYLHQEGRGIGIANKLRAYKLQEMGVDTYEANRMLGFDEDERDFFLAGAILKTLGVQEIRMLTNNPHKMAAMEKTGVSVKERVPLIIKSGTHNHSYLDAKSKKAGHLF